MVIAAVGWSGSLGAQAPRPWNVAVGIGARTGRPAQDGAAVVGEIGRSVYAASRVTLDLRLTAGTSERRIAVFVSPSEPGQL